VSPDGKTLGIPDNAGHLRFVDAEGGKTAHLFDNAAFGSPPAFTADGSSVAFFTSPKPGTEYVAVADRRTLTVRRRLSFDPIWEAQADD
jgi:hypothetical protein